jgi:serine/threonine protein kinase
MSNFPDFSDYGYSIQQELGSNRAGGRVTYLAVDDKTQQQVVIKQFQFAKSGSSWSDYDAYQREIQLLRSLDHPGIPCYLNSFQTPDGFCMVQEYKNAASLAIARSFSPEQIRSIAVSMLQILVYLQNQIPAVIHRDVKPENVLVSEQTDVYLVDFGFARIGDGEVGVSSVVKGTLGFMPPEQLFNRQLTEASDLYGLGMTLICLLTGTKSNQIGDLVDISYQVKFKHLVSKLDFHWVNWLEKMVEPKIKNRYPNAIAALAAMPAHPMRSPEATLSQSSLDFKATRLNDRLIQTIRLSNLVPETQLEGEWQVAPHPQDPPHTPDTHTWISFQPKKFVGNDVECKISVNTDRLMSEKIYVRNVLLQTNSLSTPYTLTLQVQTAPIPIRAKTLPYSILVLLFLFSAAIAWVMSWIVKILGSVDTDPLTAAFSTEVGVVFGFEAIAWMLAAAGARTGAIANVIAGATLGIVAFLMMLTGSVTTGSTTTIVCAAIGCICGMILGLATGMVVERSLQNGMSWSFSISVSLLAAVSGIFWGVRIIVGFWHPLALTIGTAIDVALVALLIHFPLQKIRRIADYRKTEQFLIKP